MSAMWDGDNGSVYEFDAGYERWIDDGQRKMRKARESVNVKVLRKNSDDCGLWFSPVLKYERAKTGSNPDGGF